MARIQKSSAQAEPTPPPTAERIDTWEQVRRDLHEFNRWRSARERELAADEPRELSGVRA